MDRKQIGRIGLSKAIDYFTLKGYTISLPLNDTQWYDLVIEKNGCFQTVQCKATFTEEAIIDFRNMGGTSGLMYSHELDFPIDLFFCVDKELNCFIIPRQDLIDYGVKNSIRLRTSKTTNNQGFQTFKYLVHFNI